MRISDWSSDVCSSDLRSWPMLRRLTSTPTVVSPLSRPVGLRAMSEQKGPEASCSMPSQMSRTDCSGICRIAYFTLISKKSQVAVTPGSDRGWITAPIVPDGDFSGQHAEVTTAVWRVSRRAQQEQKLE